MMFETLKQVLMNLLLCNHNPNTVIVIFPGFGMLATDYESILPPYMPKIYLELWHDEVLEKITKDIGRPGTSSYNAWFHETMKNCTEQIESSLTEYNNTKVIYFGHSFGSEFAHHTLKHADVIVTYGGVIPVLSIPTSNLLGTNDRIATKYYANVWPEGATPIENGGHFSCVSKKAAARSLTWRNELGIPGIAEYDEHKNEKNIKENIRNEISKFINQSLNSNT